MILYRGATASGEEHDAATYKGYSEYFYVFPDGVSPITGQGRGHLSNRYLLPLCRKVVCRIIPETKKLKPGESMRLNVSVSPLCQ